MEALLDSDDLDDGKEFHVLGLGLLEKLVKRDHGYGIHEESGLDVPLRDLSNVPHFVVLVLWLELKKELYICQSQRVNL